MTQAITLDATIVVAIISLFGFNLYFKDGYAYRNE